MIFNYLIALILISEACQVLNAPILNSTLTKYKTKHKPLPFEDDFDSEYDYGSEEYQYLTLDDIQHALTQRNYQIKSPTSNLNVQSRRSKRSISESHRFKRQYRASTAPTPSPSFIFNDERSGERQPQIQNIKRNCQPSSTICNRTSVILVLPDDRKFNFDPSNDRVHMSDDDEHRGCRKKKCKKHKKRRHRGSGSNRSGGSNENSENSKERKQRLKELKRNHHHDRHRHQSHNSGSGSNESNGSGKKNRKKHHHHHHHHRPHDTRHFDCLDYLLRRDGHNERYKEHGTSPCRSRQLFPHSGQRENRVSSTTRTERSYDIDIRAGF